MIDARPRARRDLVEAVEWNRKTYVCEPLPEERLHALTAARARPLVVGRTVAVFSHVGGTADCAWVERQTALLSTVRHIIEVHQVSAVIGSSGQQV